MRRLLTAISIIGGNRSASRRDALSTRRGRSPRRRHPVPRESGGARVRRQQALRPHAVVQTWTRPPVLSGAASEGVPHLHSRSKPSGTRPGISPYPGPEAEQHGAIPLPDEIEAGRALELTSQSGRIPTSQRRSSTSPPAHAGVRTAPGLRPRARPGNCRLPPGRRTGPRATAWLWRARSDGTDRRSSSRMPESEEGGPIASGCESGPRPTLEGVTNFTSWH